MRVIHVQSPGLFTTVQDLGRQGYGPMGVSASGVADPISLRIGNRLVGNPESAAALEMTLLGGTFSFSDHTLFSLAGSDFGATLDGEPVSWWTEFEAHPGQTLTIGSTRSGARCYLCVQGAILVKPFLGSSSTHILSGLGGLDGRALREGDRLDIGAAIEPFEKRALAPEVLQRLSPRKILRVTAGPQRDWFSESLHRAFCSGIYRVSEESNRMGIRLQGPAIPSVAAGAMITEGVSLGAIQVPPSGQPIILFVEQQTTGGYPKIANIISADLSSVGQLRPRDEIRFEYVELDTAYSLLREQETLLASKELIEKR